MFTKILMLLIGVISEVIVLAIVIDTVIIIYSGSTSNNNPFWVHIVTLVWGTFLLFFIPMTIIKDWKKK